jgi:hypothetical protein
MTIRCTRCRGELLPEWGPYRRCPTCRERVAALGASWRIKPGVADRINAKRRAARRAQADEINSAMREERAAKQLDGVCIYCTEPAADDSDFCLKHRDSHRAASLAYYHRKQAEKRMRAAATGSGNVEDAGDLRPASEAA